ncbi:MAG: UDP-glucose 4-epimerase GalE [Bacteroidota bacterium]
MSKILVTGGCGYIGSHTLIDLIDNGFEVVCADSLIRSSEDALDGIEAITGVRVQNYAIDLCDLEATRQIFKDHPDITGTIHFAALKAVGESVEIPLDYFSNNLNSLLNMLRCHQEFGVPNFIFSSSCSVYGNSTELPVTENTPLQQAESPYALTKQMGEYMIRDFSKANPAVQSILLRYFNPAGAHESGKIGEVSFGPPRNLVPAITETALGKREKLTVFGDDYDTRDGSCVRDYIHVMDLANAHTKAVQFLMRGEQDTNCEVFNLGIGAGVTVLEALKAFEAVTGQKLNYEIGPRRDGDVVAVYSDLTRASALLKWKPTRDIEDIMRTAWAWDSKRAGVDVV